jgi:hypothetical protein
VQATGYAGGLDFGFFLWKYSRHCGIVKEKVYKLQFAGMPRQAIRD